jgi:hypothetical protein
MQSGVRLQSTTMHFGAPHREDLRSGMCPSCRETMCCRDRWSFQRTQHAPPNSLRREKFSGNASRTASKPLLTCYWISVCAKANGAILLRSSAWSSERRTPEEHTAARATSEQVWCRCGPLYRETIGGGALSLDQHRCAPSRIVKPHLLTMPLSLWFLALESLYPFVTKFRPAARSANVTHQPDHEHLRNWSWWPGGFDRRAAHRRCRKAGPKAGFCRPPPPFGDGLHDERSATG